MEIKKGGEETEKEVRLTTEEVRPVPFALKAEVEAELDRLEFEGRIEKSNFSEWASPVVPHMKADGSLRI